MVEFGSENVAIFMQRSTGFAEICCCSIFTESGSEQSYLRLNFTMKLLRIKSSFVLLIGQGLLMS